MTTYNFNEAEHGVNGSAEVDGFGYVTILTPTPPEDAAPWPVGRLFSAREVPPVEPETEPRRMLEFTEGGPHGEFWPLEAAVLAYVTHVTGAGE